MHQRLRRLSVLTTLLLALVVVFWPAVEPAHAGDKHDPEYGGRDCICYGSDEGGAVGACQHWLRNPKTPTEDPCWCHRCRNFSHHDGGSVPEGMNRASFSNGKMPCYLKRHAVAWGITCNECVVNDKCCNTPNPQNCPDSGVTSAGNPLERDAMGRPAKETVLKRLAAEKRHFKKSAKVRVLYNRNFYLVTDISGLKVKTQSGAPRVMSGHEWAHLMIERLEYARREFSDHFGGGLQFAKPMGVFLPTKERDAQRIQAAYMGSPKTNILYGGSTEKGPGDSMCLNGFCASGQKFGDDHDLHMAVRHMAGHEFISCWTKVDGNNRSLPRWLFVGAAHWLCKLQYRFRDDVTFCGNESTPISGSGKNWEAACAKFADSKKTPTIEELFGKTSSNQLDLKDHQRSWSYLHICLREWREPFVNALRGLRNQKEPRDTWMKNMNCTPEVFDRRWKDRVTGRRRNISPEFDEDDFEGNEAPGIRDRRKLKKETDLRTLAALIRGLGTVDDPKTVELLIDLLSKDSELVRSQIMVTLLKIKDAEVQESMWQYGLHHKNAMARAFVARACGVQKFEWSLPRLRELLEDKHWLVRAEAGVSCGKMKDVAAMKGLRALVHDSAEKTRVGAMDALGMYGEDAQMAVPLIMQHLKAGAWQLRIAACQSLGKIGSMEAVEPLIARMEVESGRLRKEIQEALKEITRDDLGKNPKFWRDWWDKLKNNTPGGMPQRPEDPKASKKKKGPDPDERYAKQKYYGIELYTSRIGFVLDTSLSMESRFEPDPSAARQLSRDYTGQNKLWISKEEIAQGLKTLDPRAHFNIISFNTTIRTFKKNPVPASSGNIQSAIGFLQGLPPSGETNYYGALRAALDIEDTRGMSQNFRDTPDTLTFLTDGSPTRGEITDADVLLEWYTTLNRYARIRTHVICFGTKGVDLVLLRNMAELNGGRFVMVPEKK